MARQMVRVLASLLATSLALLSVRLMGQSLEPSMVRAMAIPKGRHLALVLDSRELWAPWWAIQYRHRTSLDTRCS